MRGIAEKGDWVPWLAVCENSARASSRRAPSAETKTQMVIHERRLTLAMPIKNREAIDALAQRVIESRAELDYELHRNKRRFPVDEFDRFWRAFLDYCAGM